MINFNLLRLIIVLYNVRKTVVAAEHLGVSQPTISMMLKKLRMQFNDPLFIRDHNHFEPTHRCHEIMLTLPRLLAEMEALYYEEDEWFIDQMRGRVQLLFSSPMMSSLAAPLVKKLTEQAPQLSVDILLWGKEATRQLELNNNSWGVSYLPVETNKVLWQKNLTYQDQFTLITRKNHPVIGGSIEQLSKYPLCVNINPCIAEGSMAEMVLRDNNLDKHVSVRTSDISMMLSLISLSDYIGIISLKANHHLTSLFETFPIPLLLRDNGSKRKLALFTHQRYRTNPFTQWLFNEINHLLNDNDDKAHYKVNLKS